MPAQSPAIVPPRDLPPELLRELSALGIDPDSLPDPDVGFVGIGSASGPKEYQAEIDAWIESGGIPEFEDD